MRTHVSNKFLCKSNMCIDWLVHHHLQDSSYCSGMPEMWGGSKPRCPLMECGFRICPTGRWRSSDRWALPMSTHPQECIQSPETLWVPFALSDSCCFVLCICFVVSQRRDQGHSTDGVIHSSLGQLPGFCFDVSYLMPNMFPVQPPPWD